MGKIACVLVDDDPFVLESWASILKKVGKVMKGFRTSGELLAEVAGIDKKTPVFLDIDLRDDMSGEELAKLLRERGFTRIYYATDHSPDFVAKPAWLAGVGGKEVPDWLLKG